MNPEMSEFEKSIDSELANKLAQEFNEASFPLRRILDVSTQVEVQLTGDPICRAAMNLLEEIKKAHIKHQLPARRQQLIRDVLHSINPATPPSLPPV